ncbi:MAG: hypothetical protein MUF86_16625 [Akkermansiaceae bacterium]|jgi:hypothetical protein|nr:hypothetical protein [Akkermansiaceae bacterium]
MIDKPRTADIQASSIRRGEMAIHHIPCAVSIFRSVDDLIFNSMLKQRLRKQVPLWDGKAKSEKERRLAAIPPDGTGSTSSG